MIINVLISTINAGIRKIENILQPQITDVKYIISHQFTDVKYKKIPSSLLRDDVIITQIGGKGLSRSRNNALEFAEGDIAVIADDDIAYLPDTFNIIKEVYTNNPFLDVVCFKIKTNQNEPEYKNYPSSSYVLNDAVKHYLSSVEITFRIKSIRDKSIVFDNRFGLGSNYIPSGEEEIFIYDCLKAKLRIAYYPYYIVRHGYKYINESHNPFASLLNFKYAAIDAYKMGWKSIPYSFTKTWRIRKTIMRSGKKPIIYILDRLKGCLYILLTKR